MNTVDLVALLGGAINRYRSVRMTVFHSEDCIQFLNSMKRFTRNQALQSIAKDLQAHLEERMSLSIWSVYVERPYRWRVDHFTSLDRLYEVAGGNEHAYWHYFPAARRASLLPHQPDQTLTPLALFTGWLPAAVSELLDPSFLLNHPDDAAEAVQFEIVGETSHAARAAIRIRATISDWHSRTPWAETLRAAEEYELVVDKEVGALLRVASRSRNYEFSVYDVFDLQWDPSIDASMFELRTPPGTKVSRSHLL